MATAALTAALTPPTSISSQQQKSWLTMLNEFLKCYKWLSDCYIIEFFTEHHWDKLPLSWRTALNETTLTDFCRQLFRIQCSKQISSIDKSSDSGGGRSGRVLPLSLLAFTATARCLSLSGSKSESRNGNGNDRLSQVPGIHHMFRKHVNPKKQHEIKQLGKVIHNLCEQMNCHDIVDIGCGQGHLARYLAYNYGLNVTAVEAVESHLETATKYVNEINKDVSKKQQRSDVVIGTSTGSVKYIQKQLTRDTNPMIILDMVTPNSTNGLDIDTETNRPHPLIIIGLHTCGDLTPFILQMFTNDDRITGLVLVGCCYMKLSCDTHMTSGYPMSQYMQSMGEHQLSYEARELACHSKDSYYKRLQDNSHSSSHLMIHCYRAAVEVIMRKMTGVRRHQVKISKQVSKMPFEQYAKSVLMSVDLTLSSDDLDHIRPLLSQWTRVVMFFMLRLSLAPCIETVLVLDRVLYLTDHGINSVYVDTCFDSLVSPRNLLITALKTT